MKVPNAILNILDCGVCGSTPVARLWRLEGPARENDWMCRIQCQCGAEREHLGDYATDALGQALYDWNTTQPKKPFHPSPQFQSMLDSLLPE